MNKKYKIFYDDGNDKKMTRSEGIDNRDEIPAKIAEMEKEGHKIIGVSMAKNHHNGEEITLSTTGMFAVAMKIVEIGVGNDEEREKIFLELKENYDKFNFMVQKIFDIGLKEFLSKLNEW